MIQWDVIWIYIGLVTVIGSNLDRKNGAMITVDAPPATHSAIASGMLGLASSMCAVLTKLLLEVALQAAHPRQQCLSVAKP
jgi:hypothetical protein